MSKPDPACGATSGERCEQCGALFSAIWGECRRERCPLSESTRTGPKACLPCGVSWTTPVGNCPECGAPASEFVPAPVPRTSSAAATTVRQLLAECYEALWDDAHLDLRDRIRNELSAPSSGGCKVCGGKSLSQCTLRAGWQCEHGTAPAEAVKTPAGKLGQYGDLCKWGRPEGERCNCPAGAYGQCQPTEVIDSLLTCKGSPWNFYDPEIGEVQRSDFAEALLAALERRTPSANAGTIKDLYVEIIEELQAVDATGSGLHEAIHAIRVMAGRQ